MAEVTFREVFADAIRVNWYECGISGKLLVLLLAGSLVAVVGVLVFLVLAVAGVVP